MLTRDGKRLRVFDEFVIDRSLPKHLPTERAELMQQATKYGTRSITMGMNQSADSVDIVGAEEDFTPMWQVGNSSITVTTQNGILAEMSTNGQKKPFFLLRWWQAFLDAFRNNEPEPPVALLSTYEFFSSLKNSVEELEVVATLAQRYEAGISQALRGGQRALAERLTKTAQVRRTEVQLIAIAETRFLEEATVVEFVKKAEKGVRLDWVANFIRPIPAELVDKKRRCDELHVFDNYAVMHYDPAGKSWAETEEERKERERKQRDPILFGLIKDSRRLYYLGDWEDDTCNLTLDELARVMGGPVAQELEA